MTQPPAGRRFPYVHSALSFAAGDQQHTYLLERIEDRVSVGIHMSVFPPALDTIWNWEATHGGRKNCSSSTYMPRSISVMRKYFPTLSNVLSFSWSHRGGVARRKFLGGGPDGVA